MQEWTNCLDQELSRIELATIALLLVGVFEMVVKITARHGRFFLNYWNCFDLFCVAYSLLAEVLLWMGIRYHVSWWVLELFQVRRLHQFACGDWFGLLVLPCHSSAPVLWRMTCMSTAFSSSPVLSPHLGGTARLKLFAHLHAGSLCDHALCCLVVIPRSLASVL